MYGINNTSNPYFGQGQSYYNPYMTTNIIYVNGIEDAKSRPVNPGCELLMADNEKPLMYKKIVDTTGHFEMKIYDVAIHKEEEAKPVEYVSREEFEEVIAKLKAESSKED